MSSYIKTEDHITMVFDDGESATVYSTNPYFSKVVSAISAGDWAEARYLSQPVEHLREKLADAQITDRVTIQHGEVAFDGNVMHNTLTSRMLDMVAEGFDVTPMANFLTNLMNNPSHRAVTELYGFLEHSDLPITEDGCFVAYKRVREDYKDIHSGTMDNSVGQVVEMARNQVDDDKDRTCSTGLHFCSRDYLSSFGAGHGNRTVVVKVNPADVVSIPSDYNNAKGRACRYMVIGELEHQHEEELENYSLYRSTEFDEEIDLDYEVELEEEDLSTRLEIIMMEEGVAIKQIELATDRWVGVFANPSEAEADTGIDSSNIYKVIRGERASAGGYVWELVSD